MENTIYKRFRQSLKREPQKSLEKYGVINEVGALLPEGKDTFIQWLFEDQEFQKRFYDEVIVPMAVEDKRKK